MYNIYLPQKAKVISIGDESIDTKLCRLQFTDKKIQQNFKFLAGQFMQIGLAGWGECPISMASSSYFSNQYLELAIRDVGKLTHKLHQLKAGDLVDLRGPFGNGFDVDLFTNKPLILIGGGCGFIPLRPLVEDFMANRIQNTVLQIFYGCKNEETLLFKRDYQNWTKRAELDVVLEKPSKDWQGEKGLITAIFAKRKITPNSVAVLVGPSVMYKFVIAELKNRKVKDENIFLSLERKMYCGYGVCQHCAIGPYYVCKDGPVFRWSEIKNIAEVI